MFDEFESQFFESKGSRLHYIDEGRGFPLLIVHGTPTNSYEYRKVIKDLSGSRRIIAIDHLGFGKSDKPAEKIEIETHSENLLALVNKLKLEKFDLLVHDFGGPIGLNAVSGITEKVNKIFILNSWAFDLTEFEDFKKMKNIINSPITKFLYLYLNFSARVLLKKGIYKKELISKEVLKAYSNAFPNSKSRWGTYSFALDLINRQGYFKNAGEILQNLDDKNIALIWGMKDELLKTPLLDKFQILIPNAKVHKLECGHFIAEEMPDELVEIIKEFSKSNTYK